MTILSRPVPLRGVAAGLSESEERAQIEMRERVSRFVQAKMICRAYALEALLADCIALQDYDQLDRIIVVTEADGSQGVASTLGDPPWL